MDKDTTILGLSRGSLVRDRYQIRDLLGQGGFAAVFLAHDTEIERNVALKVLDIASLARQGGDIDILLTRFKREAKLAARIRHPSVVQIFDYGVLEHTDGPFIIMEQLEGHDLREELHNHGPMSPERALPLFVDCLEALGDAHQLGIVHKDLKPSNLFLSSPGNRRESFKIVDFGIAHPGDTDGERLTKTGFMLGTMEYMPPEYIQEQTVSPALDVYQMGLILVEMLTGRPVVDGKTPWQVAMAQIRRDFEIPSVLLDSPAGSVIGRALAVEPQDRFDDAGDFADALAAVEPDELPYGDTADTWEYTSMDTLDVQPPDDETRTLIEEASRQRRIADQQAAQPSSSSSPSRSEDDSPDSASDDSSSPPPANDTALTESPADPADGDTTEPQPFSDFHAPSRAQTSARSSRVIIGVLATVLLLTLVGIGFVASALLSRESGDEPAARHAEAEEPLSSEPQQPTGESPPSQPDDQQQPDDHSERIEVAIAADPEDASITHGDDNYDNEHPLVFDSPDDDPVDLEVTADGYDSRTVTVSPGDTPAVDVALQPHDDTDDEPTEDTESSAQPSTSSPQPTEPSPSDEQIEPTEQPDESDEDDEPADSDDDPDQTDESDEDGSTDLIMAP